MLTSKMSVQTISGKMRGFYIVEEETTQVASVNAAQKKTLGHHIILVDRSGSMWGEMASVSMMLEKVLTLQEFADSALKVSLISYSSQGDARTHFERVTISDIMVADSKYLKEIRNLRAGGLTCISQSLRSALPLIKQGEVTGITLHSDGYANDPSAFLEKAQMEAFLKDIQAENVFLNTIAYQSYADFALLSRLASMASGRCVQARTSKEVFQAIQEISTLLGASVSLSEPISVEGYDRVVIQHGNAGQKRLNTFLENGELRGLEVGDVLTKYKYREITSKEFFESNLSESNQNTNRSAYFALALSLLNSGELNLAKEVALSSEDYEGSFPHVTALSADAVKHFSDYLQTALFVKGGIFTASQAPSFPTTTLLDFISTWEECRAGVVIDMPFFLGSYKKKGLKRIAGTRDAAGNLVPLSYNVKVKEEAEVVAHSFVLSKDSPNINLTVQYQATIETDEGIPVTSVAGIDVRSIATYRNYTLVNNGELYTKKIRIRFNRKSAFLTFQQNGYIPSDATFNPKEYFEIDLTQYMLCSFDFDEQISPIKVLNQIFMGATIESLMKSMLKESSTEFSSEQIQELKKVGLTPALNLSSPTVYDFVDLKTEINEGRVDSRNFFRVKFGTKDIPSSGALMSANKFLERMYTVEVDGNATAKPTGLDLLNANATVSHKTLSAKLKVTPIDSFQKQVYDHLFNLSDNEEVAQLLTDAGVTREELFSPKNSVDERIVSIAKLRSFAGRNAHRNTQEVLVPLAYYISVTGMLPDHLNSPMLTGEQVVEKYPEIKLSKSEKEGLFFVSGELLISVSEDTEYYYTKS